MRPNHTPAPMPPKPSLPGMVNGGSCASRTCRRPGIKRWGDPSQGRGRGRGARRSYQPGGSLSALYAFGGGVPLLAALDRPARSPRSADDPHPGLSGEHAGRSGRRDADRVSPSATPFRFHHQDAKYLAKRNCARRFPMRKDKGGQFTCRATWQKTRVSPDTDADVIVPRLQLYLGQMLARGSGNQSSSTRRYPGNRAVFCADILSRILLGRSSHRSSRSTDLCRNPNRGLRAQIERVTRRLTLSSHSTG